MYKKESGKALMPSFSILECHTPEEIGWGMKRRHTNVLDIFVHGMFIWLDCVTGAFVPICSFSTFQKCEKRKREIHIYTKEKQVKSRESPTARDREKKESFKMYSRTKTKRYVSGYIHVKT